MIADLETLSVGTTIRISRYNQILVFYNQRLNDFQTVSQFFFLSEPKVSPATFCRVFPFHLMFNRDLTIVQAGSTITRVIPRVNSGICKLSDILLAVSQRQMKK